MPRKFEVIAGDADPRVPRAKIQPVAERVAGLQAVLDGLAREQTAALIEAVQHASALAGEVIESGIAKPGVLDLCRLMRDDLAKKALTLAAIEGRQ